MAESRIDDFTHLRIIRTSWEPIVKKLGANMMAHVRMSRIDSAIFFDFKVMGIGVTSVREGEDLMLKLENDSIVTLKNMKYQITCTGCGAIGFSGSEGQGLNLSYSMSNEQIKYLLFHRLKKIRIYTTSGYIEDDIQEKRATIVSDELRLVQ